MRPTRPRPAARRLAPLLLLAVACLLPAALGAGCDDDGGPGSLDGPVKESSARKEVSTRLCFEYRTCGCGELANVPLGNCELGMGYAWDAVSEESVEEGLTYDGDCLTRRLNAMRERGCEDFDSTQAFPGCGAETCLIYHGDLPEGADCDGGLSRSNCQQGLVCLGTCQVPCAGINLGVGEVCRDDTGDFVGTCALPLLCDNDTGLCRALPVDGEACYLGGCAEGHYCEAQIGGESICRALLTEGATCVNDVQCQSLLCPSGVCSPLPVEGAACRGTCAGDLVCAFADSVAAATCATAPGEGQACLTSLNPLRCAEGLACVDEVCAEPPGKGQACLPFTVSLTARCRSGLVCGGTLCRLDNDAPGCDACEDPEGNCIVEVCTEPPPAVCSDSGGLLY